MNMGSWATQMLEGLSMHAMVSEVLHMEGIVAVVVYELLELSFGLT